MVTTNSLTQDLNFELNQLLRSECPEDKELADKVIHVVSEVTAKLKPILRYIVAPGAGLGAGSRFVTLLRLAGRNPLAIDEDGTFGWAENNASFRKQDDAWFFWSVDEVLKSLQRVLVDAEAKRRQHLDAVSSRRKMLDDILQIIGAAGK